MADLSRMQIPRPARPADYREYRTAVVAERMPSAVRTAAAIIFALNNAFLPLDGYAFPELFWNFFWARMLLNASLGLAFFWTHRAHPAAGQLQLVFSAGALLLWVIYGAGAPTTEYYAGLMLLFLGFPLVLPLTVTETFGSYALLLSVFALSPWLEPGFDAWQTFAIHLLFLTGGAFTGIASSRYIDGVGLVEYRQKKEIEEARDRLEAMDRIKSRFTANVHHELRTPLTLTLAPLEALLAGEFGEVSGVQRSYLETMHVNAVRLLKLINNLLDLAKIEGEELAVRRRPISLARLAEDLVAGARPLAEQKGVTLRLSAEPGAGEINADSEAAEKILINLIGNALKFTDRGGTVEVGLVRHSGGGVHVSVCDDGVGLEASQLERIFDRFAQVDSSATRKHEGTGIGLSLTQELVSLHGGRIWAESEGLGRGTAIHVVLPQGEEDDHVEETLLEEAGAEAAPRARPARGDLRFAELARTVQRATGSASGPAPAEEAPDPSRPEILVCEDNADMRRLLKDLLAKEFRVRLAANGREGLEAVRVLPPDLVLTDVMMPEMSGIELCDAIKQDASTRGIPVVLVTSKAEREMKIEGLERGADDYVTKPFHARELLARVRSLIRLRQLQDELADRNRVLEETNADLARAMRELKEAEANMVRAERLAAVGELAAGIAHEVNNPVNFARNAVATMTSFVSDLQEVVTEARKLVGNASPEDGEDRGRLRRLLHGRALEEATAGLEELAAIATDGLDRTGRLVGDLRDFAAPGRGERCPVDLAHTVESALQLTRYSFQQAGVRVELELTPGTPPVEADPRALSQVLLNLLKNAVEAIEKPGGCVWVKVGPAGSGVRVDVRDDGPGIPAGILGRLFEPFFTSKAAGEGTGLGLSISKQVIEEHGGTLEVTSEPGKGALFSFWLPAEAPHGD